MANSVTTTAAPSAQYNFSVHAGVGDRQTDRQTDGHRNVKAPFTLETAVAVSDAFCLVQRDPERR